MMRGLLDLSDDGLAVTLEGAEHDHEPSESQVTLQHIAAHLSDLLRQQKDPSQFVMKSIPIGPDHSDKV